MPYKDPAIARAKARERSARPEIKAHQKELRDRPEAKERRKAYEKTEQFKKIRRKSEHDRNQRLKLFLMIHYGKGKAECVHCGFSDMDGLTLDHINNDGAAHRRQILKGKHGCKDFYRWVKRNNYPSGLQTLCSNCQSIKKARPNEFMPKQTAQLVLA